MSPSFLLVAVLFPVSELVLAILKRARGDGVRTHDRGTIWKIWLAIAVGILAAFTAIWSGIGHLPLSRGSLEILAILLFIPGFILRWMAVFTLGREFTVNVAIQDGHELRTGGVYRWVRHPSYTGLLVEFVALGSWFGNWLSAVVLLAPVTWAIVLRIRVEEAALTEFFGDRYREYATRTKCLIPGVW